MHLAFPSSSTWGLCDSAQVFKAYSTTGSVATSAPRNTPIRSCRGLERKTLNASIVCEGKALTDVAGEVKLPLRSSEAGRPVEGREGVMTERSRFKQATNDM